VLPNKNLFWLWQRVGHARHARHLRRTGHARRSL